MPTEKTLSFLKLVYNIITEGHIDKNSNWYVISLYRICWYDPTKHHYYFSIYYGTELTEYFF